MEKQHYVFIFSDAGESYIFSDFGIQMQVQIRFSSRATETVSQYQKSLCYWKMDKHSSYNHIGHNEDST